MVWEKVRRAIRKGQVLRMQYLSPRHEQPEPRVHTVEPYQLRFHRGHYELRAYCRRWRNPWGQERHDAGWFRYRLDHILPDELTVLPNKLSPGQRDLGLVAIRYRLSPGLVRGGVSRHFEEMEMSEPDADGWVEVTGKTDDPFEALRILLAYGEHCWMLGPATLVRDMERAARGMAEL